MNRNVQAPGLTLSLHLYSSLCKSSQLEVSRAPNMNCTYYSGCIVPLDNKPAKTHNVDTTLLKGCGKVRSEA